MPETAEKTARQLQIRRVVPASAEEIFDAWTDPRSMEQWMLPGTSTAVKAKLDVRVGGWFSIEMHSPEKTFPHKGKYLRVERPRLLEFTWISEATEERESIVTVELVPRGKETELVLTHRLLPNEESAKNHEAGWGQILDKLSRHLQTR